MKASSGAANSRSRVIACRPPVSTPLGCPIRQCAAGVPQRVSAPDALACRWAKLLNAMRSNSLVPPWAVSVMPGTGVRLKYPQSCNAERRHAYRTMPDIRQTLGNHRRGEIPIQAQSSPTYWLILERGFLVSTSALISPYFPLCFRLLPGYALGCVVSGALARE